MELMTTEVRHTHFFKEEGIDYKVEWCIIGKIVHRIVRIFYRIGPGDYIFHKEYKTIKVPTVPDSIEFITLALKEKSIEV
jgi:hypothetical protein